MPDKPQRSESCLCRIMIFVLAPFVVTCLIFLAPLVIGVGVLAISWNWLIELLFQRKMRRSGRYLTLQQCKYRIVNERGTLIIEFPLLGWGNSRAWWTPENILLNAPRTPPTQEERGDSKLKREIFEWDRWCFMNFTSEETGRALLIRAWHGTSVEKKLRLYCSDLTVVHTVTGIASLEDPEEWLYSGDPDEPPTE